MYKVFLQFPEALRPAFPRLKEKLEDPDQGKKKFTLMSPTSVFGTACVIVMDILRPLLFNMACQTNLSKLKIL